MMKNKFYLQIALAHTFAFGVSSAFAALPANPNNQFHWYSTLAATYMQPSNISYLRKLNARYIYNYVPESSHDGVINPDYQAGLNAVLGYFLNEQDDASIDYTYNDFNDSSHTVNMANSYNSIKDRYKTTYHSVSYHLGHHFSAEYFTMRLYGGIDFTYIKQAWSELATPNPARSSLGLETLPPLYLRKPWTFYGVGPQLGIDVGSYIQDHFTLTGGINVALLTSSVSAGSQVPLGNATTYINPKAGTVYYKRSAHTYNQAVKSQAKIGLAYQQIIQNNPLSVELGYKGILVQDQILGAATGFSLSMHGPYLSAGLSF